MTLIAISPTEAKDEIQLSLLQVLGQGGFGKVFLADVQSGYAFQQRVAVKVLHPEYQQETQLLARQLDEARMLGLLNHRNIVKVFDICNLSGQNAILMEYVEGVSLSEMLKHQSIPWGITWQLVADCASALTAALQSVHPQTGRRLRLIHRDIKPSNLLVSKSGTLKVLDFGIAKMDGNREAKTSTHQMGTARYMAPEQWLENTSSSSVDVYALGRTALEMLLGRLIPRTPLDPRLHREQLQTHLQEIPRDAPSRILFDAGVQLLMDMLSHDPNLRPTVEVVADRALALAEAEGVVSIGSFVRERMDAIATERNAVPDDKHSRQELAKGAQILLEYPIRMGELSNTTLSMQREGFDLFSEKDSVGEVDSLKASRNLFGIQTVLVLVLGLVAVLSVRSLTLEGDVSLKDSTLTSIIASTTDATTDPTTDPTIASAQEVVLEDSDGRMNVQRTLLKQDASTVAAVSKDKTSKQISSRNGKNKTPMTPRYEVVISSVPLGAEVFVDNTNVGRTLVTIQQLTEGEHQIRMRLGDSEIERMIVVDSSGRFVWRTHEEGESEWLSY